MREIKIDFDNPGLPQRLDVVENDAQSRFFKAVLYKDGKAYAAPSGATYSIMYRGFGPQNEGWYDTINDGAGKRAACSVSGNVVTCEIARQALRVPGHVSVMLCVTSSNGYMLHGWPIDCNCRNDSYTGGTSVESFFYITQVTNANWNSAIQTWEELKNMIDPTLSVSGKAADAAKVGEKLKENTKSIKETEKSKLDKRKVLNQIDCNVEDGVINRRKQIYLEDIYKHCVIDNVESGQYAISCFSVNSDYVGAFVEKEGQNTIILFSDNVTAHIREVITIPEIYNNCKIYINGRTDKQMMELFKIIDEPSENFWDEYNNLKRSIAELSAKKYRSKVGIHLKSDESCDVFLHNYEENRDMIVQVSKKGINLLPDITRIGSVENKEDEALVDSTGLTIRQITGGTTDYLSPSVIYAVNNLDGDFPDMISGKYTGGWHGYNNATQNVKPTARNISYKVFCDEKTVSLDEKTRGDSCIIDIVNRVQASNTEKSDGNGREVIEQHFRLLIDKDFTIQVDGEITALEDVHYQLYFGVSLLHTMPENVFFVGSRVNRSGQNISTVNYSGDKFCTFIKQVGENDTLEMGIDTTVDLGTQYANLERNSFIMSSSKSYAVLINCDGNDSNRLSLKKGEKVFWKGYYKCYPTA